MTPAGFGSVIGTRKITKLRADSDRSVGLKISDMADVEAGDVCCRPNSRSEYIQVRTMALTTQASTQPLL